MNTLLLTGFDKRMEPVGLLTSPLMSAYAERHGIPIRIITDFSDGKVPYWRKIPAIKQAFNEGFDQVLWMDADIVITNPSLDLFKTLTSGFHASKDWGEDAVDETFFSMCNFVINKDAVGLIDWCIEHEEEYVHGPFPDQWPMQHLMRTNVLGIPMKTHSRRVFNSVPAEVHSEVVEPWQPGDFVAHLTMLSVPDRVTIFHKIQEQNG